MMSIRTLFLGYTLLTSMQGMFGDKQGNKLVTAFKWPLICEAFSNNQTHCKLLRDTLVTSRHLVRFKGHFGNKQALWI